MKGPNSHGEAKFRRISNFLGHLRGEQDSLQMRGSLRVTRMLANPRAVENVREMYAQWLQTRGLDMLVKDDPTFDSALGAAMEHELRLLASDVVLGSGDGRLATLLQAPYTFVNDGLLAFYGDDVTATDGTPGPSTFVRAQLDPEHRGGLMTLPGVMPRHSRSNRVGLSIRGLIFREAWLCNSIPPEPPDVDGDVEGDSRYEIIESLLDQASCAGCHQILEPPQVAFDNYDELGRWQEEIEEVPSRATANSSA